MYVFFTRQPKLHTVPGFACNNLIHCNPMARLQTIAGASRERIEPFQPIIELHNVTMFTVSEGGRPNYLATFN